MNKEKIALEVEEERQKQNQFLTYHNLPKSFAHIQANVLYNETAVLRENYNLEKAKKEEEAAIQKILIEKQDSKDFYRWKREMEENDKIKQLEEVSKRKINVELLKENCLENRQKKLIENKVMMTALKEEVICFNLLIYIRK